MVQFDSAYDLIFVDVCNCESQAPIRHALLSSDTPVNSSEP